jgi:hypothetical protein
MGMRTGGLLLVGTSALVLAVAAPAQNGAPSPTYLSTTGSSYALISNASWQVKEGKRVTAAKEVQVITPASPNGSAPRDRQSFAYIWGRSCTSKKQTLVFKRQVFLPGPPKTFAATVSDTTAASPPADRAIAGVRLYVNGKHMFSIRGASSTVERTEHPAYTGRFRHGANEVELRVVKRATNKAKGTGLCKTGGRRLGLAFTLDGDFEADLWVSEDGSVTHETYEEGPAGGSTLDVPVELPFRNLGPSGAYSGWLRVNISGSTLKQMSVGNARAKGAGLEDCTTSGSGFSYRIDCVIDRAPPGATPAVTADLRIVFHPTYGTANVFITAEAYSPTTDPKRQNNGWRAITYFCGPDQNNPKCPQ